MVMIRKVLMLVGCSLVLPGLARADDLKKIQGYWQPVMAKMGNQDIPEETLKSLSLHISGSNYKVQMGEIIDEGVLKLDDDQSPRAMDITGTSGPNKGKTFPAIYEIKGDTLMVCYALTEKGRPKDFKALPERSHFIVVYQRMK
jgi:uncharacterized protein (TIGR03067 family)